MKARFAVIIALLAAATTCVSLQANDSNALTSSGEGSRAVDASGMTHTEPMHPGKMPLWFGDCIKHIGPEYPFEARARHYTGTGRFRLHLDIKTGEVAQITVLKSTGFQSLDTAALAALRKWRWKPGKWKEIDIPVVFKLEQGPQRIPARGVLLPRS